MCIAPSFDQISDNQFKSICKRVRLTRINGAKPCISCYEWIYDICSPFISCSFAEPVATLHLILQRTLLRFNDHNPHTPFQVLCSSQWLLLNYI